MAVEAAAIKDRFEVLPLEDVKESKTNPRRTFDEKALDELAASIKEQGVLQPVVVRPTAGTSYELVCGARRYRASLRACATTIPAMIRDLTDDQALEIQILENVQRRDIHPLEQAEGYKLLVSRGRDVASIAFKIGMTASSVYQTMKLAELSKEGKKKLMDGELSVGCAVQIARLTAADQVEVLDWIRQQEDYGERVTVRELAEHIAQEVLRNLSKVPWNLQDEALVPKAGSCAGCPKRTGNAPDLFSDIKAAATCTDGACFKAKLQAWSDLEKKRLEASGEKLVKISVEHTSAAKEQFGAGSVGRDRWKPIEGKKGCDYQANGLRVDGPDQGKVVKVCTNPQCRVHNPHSMGTAGMSAEEKAREAAKRTAEEAKREIEKQVRREVLRQICNKVREIPKLAIAALVQREISNGDTPHETVQELVPLLKGVARYGQDVKLRARLLEAGPVELAQAAIVALCGDEAESGSAYREHVKLADFAKLLQVDQKALEKGVRAKLAAASAMLIKWSPNGLAGEAKGIGQPFIIKKAGKRFEWSCAGLAGGDGLESIEEAHASAEAFARSKLGKK